MHVAAPPDGYCLVPGEEQREYMRRSLFLARGSSRVEELLGDRLVVVGDYTARTAFAVGAEPLAVIIDCVTRLEEVGCPEPPRGYRVVRVRNPRGMVCSGAWRAVAEALREGRVVVIVDGEEDMLALPALLELGEGRVAYGIPWAGLQVVDASWARAPAEHIVRQSRLVYTGL